MIKQLQHLQEGRDARSILIVDDDRELVLSLSKLLKPFFLNCITADDGKEALELFGEHLKKNNPFTLVITDLELPKKGGLTLIKEIRTLVPEEPIIILSAHDEAEFMSEAIALEVQAYLLKPLSMPKLFSTLEKIFNKAEDSIGESHIDPVTGCNIMPDLDAFLNKHTSDTTILMKIKINHLLHIYNLVGEEYANKYLYELCSSLQNLCGENDATFYKVAKDELALLLQHSTMDFAKNLANDMTLVAKYFHLFEDGIIVNSTITVNITQGREYLTVVNAQSIMRMLYNAVENNDIIAYLQPAFHLDTDTIEFYNSYVRIKENETIFEPHSFLNVAENTHQLSMITRAVIKNIFARKHAVEPYDALLVITLCDEDIHDKSLFQYTNFWAERYNINPTQIGFEVAASALSTNLEEPFSLLDALKELGYKIILREVGLGGVDLYRLISVHPDYIKLHPTLLTMIEEKLEAIKNVQKIISLMHLIGTKVIAAKIEDTQKLAIAKSLDIDIIQGYALAHPFEIKEEDSNES